MSKETTCTAGRDEGHLRSNLAPLSPEVGAIAKAMEEMREDIAAKVAKPFSMQYNISTLVRLEHTFMNSWVCSSKSSVCKIIGRDCQRQIPRTVESSSKRIGKNDCMPINIDVEPVPEVGDRRSDGIPRASVHHEWVLLDEICAVVCPMSNEDDPHLGPCVQQIPAPRKSLRAARLEGR